MVAHVIKADVANQLGALIDTVGRLPALLLETRALLAESQLLLRQASDAIGSSERAKTASWALDALDPPQDPMPGTVAGELGADQRAPTAGSYEELNALGTPTGRVVRALVGDRLPRTLRQFGWRPQPQSAAVSRHGSAARDAPVTRSNQVPPG